MDGENWYDRANNNWLNSDVDLCDWQGVNCKLPDRQYSYYEEKEKAAAAAAALEYEEGSYREVGIDERDGKRKLLRHRKISDATPEYVFDLTDKNVDLYEYYEESFPIDSLVLNANNLSGKIPDELGMLTNIYEMIDLATNNIEGPLPRSLSMLTELEGLDLRRNKLSSTLPSELGQMVSVRKFDVSENAAIAGTVPIELSNWKNIEQLNLEATGLSNEVPVKFCNMLSTRESDFVFKTKVEEFSFVASCPYPLQCSCCTQCCHANSYGGLECEYQN